MLTEDEIKPILDSASKMLQKDAADNGDNDVACNVTFSLKAPVRTFGSVAASTKITNEQQRDAAHRENSNVAGVDFHVKVVEEIMFCRQGLDGPFNGCSFPGEFKSIIVVHPKKLINPIDVTAKFPVHLLWAHEFGHLTGLGHRHSSSALMTSCTVAQVASAPRVQVNKDECRCLRGGPGFCPLPPALKCQ
jgi:hypothetical protein